MMLKQVQHDKESWIFSVIPNLFRDLDFGLPNCRVHYFLAILNLVSEPPTANSELDSRLGHLLRNLSGSLDDSLDVSV